VIDSVTVSALATAGGTLVLAVATFASVRSANRAARAAERSLLAGLRPLLSLHNAGKGIAVLHGWEFFPGRVITHGSHRPSDVTAHRPGRLPGRPGRRAVTGRRLRVTAVRGYFSSERAITIRWIWLVPS